MKRIVFSIFILLFSLAAQQANAIVAGELIMVRSGKAFPEAMLSLQDSIKQQGYVLSGVQPVDERLGKRGFKTDKYRIVFFGKAKQNEFLSEMYPELIPYLPLKIVIFAEAGETLMVATDPAVYSDLYPYPKLRDVFRQWHEDVMSIMLRVKGM